MNFLKSENPILLRSTRAADNEIDILRVKIGANGGPKWRQIRKFQNGF